MLSNYTPPKDSCSTSGTIGGVSYGLSIQTQRSRYVNRLYRSIATRLDSDQANRDRNFRYFSTRIAINAVQMCIINTLVEVPKKVLILTFCLIVLKKVCRVKDWRGV